MKYFWWRIRLAILFSLRDPMGIMAGWRQSSYYQHEFRKGYTPREAYHADDPEDV